MRLPRVLQRKHQDPDLVLDYTSSPGLMEIHYALALAEKTLKASQLRKKWESTPFPESFDLWIQWNTAHDEAKKALTDFAEVAQPCDEVI